MRDARSQGDRVKGFLILRRPQRGRLEGRGNPFLRIVFLTLVLRDAAYGGSSG